MVLELVEHLEFHDLEDLFEEAALFVETLQYLNYALETLVISLLKYMVPPQCSLHRLFSLRFELIKRHRLVGRHVKIPKLIDIRSRATSGKAKTIVTNETLCCVLVPLCQLSCS